MSVDPTVAGSSAGAGSAAIDALVTAELNALAAEGQALQQQVAVGDVLTATVLPSNGLTDLLSILGTRVAASLPPSIMPGDQITVQVTGFNGTQVLLQMLSSSEGEPTTQTPIPIPTSTTSPTAVTTPTTSSVPAPTSAPLPGSTTPPPPGTTIAPPSSVFVAATVRPNAPTPSPIAPGTTIPDAPPESAQPGTIPGAAGTTIPTPVFGGIEARLAAARAASVTILAPNASDSAPSATPTSASSARPAPTAAPPSAPPTIPTGATPPLGGRTFVVPPQIAARFPAASPLPAPSAPATTASAAPAAAPTARTIATYQDPVTLVRALNLPVTPSNIAAARLAIEAPQRLPAALATLQSALPQSDDPRVTTLQTIVAFISKIEPSSPQLATQIAAYVEHVVSGPEPALAQLLAAHVESAAPPATAAAPEVAVAAEAAPTAEASLPVVALAQIAERAATIAVSLKEQLFSLVSGAPVGGRDAELVVPAASSALTAVTTVQLAAAASAAANPQTMSFSLPMWLGSSYAQAHLAVDRDRPDTPNVPLDGDNFHIAFVLETKHLGTVAIDLRTVGRAFALSVKTEDLPTAQRFGDELSRLTDRLSSLRYQPKSVEAVVALPASNGVAAAPAVAVATDAPPGEPAAVFNERA